MRDALLTWLLTNTADLTVRTVKELPWNTANEPLYLKNLKRFYLDQEQLEETILIPTLPGQTDVVDRLRTVTGYFAVDAKNLPSGVDQALTQILEAKNHIVNGNGLTGALESDYTTEIQDDVIIYTVQYRYTTTS